MRKALLNLSFVVGAITSFAQTFQSIPGNLDLVKAEVTFASNEGKVNEEGMIENCRHGSKVLFHLANVTKQFYTLSFDAATRNDDCKAVITVKNSGKEIQKEVAIKNSGNWSTFNTIECELGELPISEDLTMELMFLRTPGGYTANVKNLSVKANLNTSIKNVVAEKKTQRIYTIDGKALPSSTSKHGVYIVDGKKVVR